MRDILFRGKRCGNGRWVEGDLIHRNPGVYIRMMNGAQYQVNPDTVGQYTGLTDMYGTEVWEGDIVQYYGEGWDEEDGPGVIEWDQDTARFTIVNDGLTVDFDNCDSSEVKVIGNIHDDPGLMEVDE